MEVKWNGTSGGTLADFGRGRVKTGLNSTNQTYDV